MMSAAGLMIPMKNDGGCTMKKIKPVLSMLLCVTTLMFFQPAAFAWNGTDPSQHSAVGIGALADPIDWIADEWRPVGIGGGGAVFHPTTSPIQPGLIMASCDMGGAYISYDSGATWSMINFGSTASWTEAWAFTYDLKDPNIIYASRGNAGLYQTKDMGATWKRIFPNEDESITKHRGATPMYIMSPTTAPSPAATTACGRSMIPVTVSWLPTGSDIQHATRREDTRIRAACLS
jgi:hypothetical protein